MSEPDRSLRVGGPDAIKVTVCESCNRTDLHGSLKTRHYGGWGGSPGLCLGPLKDVLYVRAAVEEYVSEEQP